MPGEMTRSSAKRIISKLLGSPVAPGLQSHLINAGTNPVLDILEENYFRDELADGISCFKYVEGGYGSGKTQFIHSLAKRAHQNDIVTAIVTIGHECPFNSPKSIYKAIMGAFVPPQSGEPYLNDGGSKGIETIVEEWIVRNLRELGVEFGQEVPAVARNQLNRTFSQPPIGMPDTQAASAISALGRRLLDHQCGADFSALDTELIHWLRGENLRSRGLREEFTLHEPVRDETAFRRLKTIIKFLRTRLGCRGFFIAFDEGTRTASFRRGSVKQKQAIENMLTMINENAEGEFGGVMFLYAATPDFRSEVIQRYTALNDRIGTVPFRPGRPMTPLIELESLNSDDVIMEIGDNLMEVFSIAYDIDWDLEVQRENSRLLIRAMKDKLYFDNLPPRHFVYQHCRFLHVQKSGQTQITLEDAAHFIQTHEMPEPEDSE